MITASRNALLGAALSLVCTAAYATTYKYQFVKVPNSVQTDAVAINQTGTVLGEWYDSNHAAHGYIFSAGITTIFDVPSATSTRPSGINLRGEIVGSYTDGNQKQHGFLRTANGKFRTIDLANSAFTGLNGITDKGLIIGVGLDSAGALEVFAYTNGTFKAIIDNGKSPNPTSVNNHGAVAGFYAPPRAYETAFLYANGVVTTLPITGYSFSAAFGVNNHNQVVGQAANGGTEYGFIYNGTSKVKFIGPNGSTDSFNTGINDNGVIAGLSVDKNYNSTAYTYEKGVFSILKISGIKSVSASGINNAGQVIGNYTDANNVLNTFLATPIK